MEFSKYHGCGNDFILIDNRTHLFPTEKTQKLCARCTGIGADGVILLEDSDIADYKMRILNANGSEAEMCGNGVRCFLKFLGDLGLSADSWTIETKERVISGSITPEGYAVEMGAPTNIQWDLSLHGHSISYLNTGVPHAVLFVDDLAKKNIEDLGKKIRHDPTFAPHGTNVTFTEILSPQKLLFRTFERGVEAETLACGTGAAAAALAYQHQTKAPSSITMQTKKGDIIKIYLSPNYGVTMVGPAELVYRGSVTY